jgi:hypothetical protein
MIRRRHNKRKHKLAKERKGSEHKSDDSISTVLEEDEEELERTDSNDDGLQSLLENFLENSGERNTNSPIAGRSVNRRSSDYSEGPNRVTPRSRQNNILESLGASNAPMELRQATALLLQSSLLDEITARLLTSDILNQPLECGETIDETIGKGEERQTIETSVGFEDPNNLSASGNDHRGSCEDVSSLGLPETQSTTSLRPVMSADEILRPSIFTMHSMSPPDQE